MKRAYRIWTTLVPMIVLMLATNAGAHFSDVEKGVNGTGSQNGIRLDNPLTTSPAPKIDSEAVPEGLTATAWGKIKAAIERDRYRVQKDDQTGRYTTPNTAHGLNANFTEGGLVVKPCTGEQGWRWGLRLSKYGYGQKLQEVPETTRLITKDNRIEYHRGNMVEWYINDYRGIEQGFTLNTRPEGQTGPEPLQLEMRITGNLAPEVEKDAKGVVWRDAQGKEIFRYSGLYAYDANGMNLSARMASDRFGMRLIIEDRYAVYPITIDPFIQKMKLTSSPVRGELFGFSVSISGDTAIVGAYGDNDNGYRSGSAYIFYRYQGGADNWGAVNKLTASDGAANDYFGYSVSISGDTAIVGAYRDNDNGSYSGSAYIFYRDEGGADNWGEFKKLIASDGADYDNFGNSVSISGDKAIVGAYGDDDNGSAYIFSRDQEGADNWGEVKKLTASDGGYDDHFGISVSISGDTAIVGAYRDDDNGPIHGSAYIFSRDQGGADNEVNKLTASDGAANDNFGYSVSISGDTAIVGAYRDDDNGDNWHPDFGAAYIFDNVPDSGDVGFFSPSKTAAGK
jgi:FG-GAP repeat protein